MTATTLINTVATKRTREILRRNLDGADPNKLARLRTPWGRFQPLRMAEGGNTKIKGDVLSFSLTPGRSCLNCSDCFSTCYAMKSYRQYIQSKNCLDINTDLAEQNVPLLESLLKAQILDYQTKKKGKAVYVRIHVAGDFISQAYVDMWARVATAFPGVRFWTYTKVDHLFNFSGIPDNVNVIRSFIDGKLNFGSAGYVRDLVENHGAVECPAVGNKDIKCVRDCKHCVWHDRVAFLEH